MRNYILLFTVLCLVLVSLFSGVVIGNTYNPNVQVEGDSMHPEIHEDDLVITKEVNSINEVEVGDVITFSQKNCKVLSENIIHKVHSKTDDGLITIGVGNGYTDQALDKQGNVLPDSCVKAIDDEMINSKVVFHSNDKDIIRLYNTYYNMMTFR
jgi:signal peptidase I